MKIFSGLYNENIENKISTLLHNEVDIVSDSWQDCDAAVLATRSLTSKSGALNVKDLLEKITEDKIPCLLIANDERVITLARDKGLPEDNIFGGPKVSLNELVYALMKILGLDEYDIFIEEDYQINISDDNNPDPDFGYESPDNQFTMLAPSEPLKLNLPEKYVVITGIKGGVGASTVAAMIPATIHAFHVEVIGKDKQPTAYCYYGINQRDTKERYEYWDVTGEIPQHIHGLTVYDLGQSVPNEIFDQIIDNAPCVVLVVDRSEVSFDLTKRLLQSGFRPDILVVSKTLDTGGIGNGPEVYQGDNEEYLDDTIVLGLNGGLEEEKIIAYAQKTGRAPCNEDKSANINAFVGEFVSAIRTVLQI